MRRWILFKSVAKIITHKIVESECNHLGPFKAALLCLAVLFQLLITGILKYSSTSLEIHYPSEQFIHINLETFIFEVNLTSDFYLSLSVSLLNLFSEDWKTYLRRIWCHKAFTWQILPRKSIENSSHLTKSLLISKSALFRFYAVKWTKGKRYVGNGKYSWVTSVTPKTRERTAKIRRKILCYCSIFLQSQKGTKIKFLTLFLPRICKSGCMKR